MDCIEVWSKYGSMTDVAYWWCTESESGYPDGWYDEQGGGNLVENIDLPIGVGLYMNLSTDGATVQFAGQVWQDEVLTEELPSGYNVIGNSTPVEIDLQNVKLINADGSGYMDCIEVWSKYGSMTDVAYWWCSESESGYPDGWYDEQGGGNLVTGIKLAPGQGVFMNLSTDGVQVSIPSPMKKD